MVLTNLSAIGASFLSTLVLINYQVQLSFLIQDNTGVCVNQSEYSFSFLFGFSSIDFIIGIIELSFGYQFATSFLFCLCEESI